MNNLEVVLGVPGTRHHFLEESVHNSVSSGGGMAGFLPMCVNRIPMLKC